jgi:hypothetical protein
MAVSLETKVASASWISVVTEEAGGGDGLSGDGSQVSLGIAGREWLAPWNCPLAIQGVLLLLVGLASGDMAEPTASARTDLFAVERASKQAWPWSEKLDQMPAGRCGSPVLS